ncbi:MAG: YdcF family protein [Myxococcota bacterium]|nr:YdcF family protein [Myxococcota bacterium]
MIALLERPLVIRGEPLRALDAIVVLGAPLRADKLTPPLVERVEAAAQLYHAGGAKRVVATGGTTRGAGRSEAAAIAEGLRARGVPDVVVEDQSQTTAENATRTAALIGACSIWLVTQPFHGRRAARLFRRAGFDAHVWHIADSLQYRDRRRALRWVAREYLAWASLLVRGR